MRERNLETEMADLAERNLILRQTITGLRLASTDLRTQVTTLTTRNAWLERELELSLRDLANLRRGTRSIGADRGPPAPDE